MAGWIKAMDAAALPAESKRRVELNGAPLRLVRGGERLRASLRAARASLGF